LGYSGLKPPSLLWVKRRHRPATGLGLLYTPRADIGDGGCDVGFGPRLCPFVNLAQAATYEAKSAENPANFRPPRWGTGGEPLPQKQHKKAAKAHRIVR
jgi:hypothetical protein